MVPRQFISQVTRAVSKGVDWKLLLGGEAMLLSSHGCLSQFALIWRANEVCFFVRSRTLRWTLPGGFSISWLRRFVRIACVSFP